MEQFNNRMKKEKIRQGVRIDTAGMKYPLLHLFIIRSSIRGENPHFYPANLRDRADIHIMISGRLC